MEIYNKRLYFLLPFTNYGDYFLQTWEPLSIYINAQKGSINSVTTPLTAIVVQIIRGEKILQGTCP